MTREEAEEWIQQTRPPATVLGLSLLAYRSDGPEVRNCSRAENPLLALVNWGCRRVYLTPAPWKEVGR